MRLIDAEALKEYILRSVPNWSEDREIVLDCIANSPTIEERKKGKWIFKDDRRIVDGYDWQCDKCGSYQRYTSNYCPHCGADLRGGDDEQA